MANYAIQVTVGGTTSTVYTDPQNPLITVVLDPNEVILPDAPTITTGVLDIITSSLPDATQNSAYSATLNATGGVGPYTWALVSGSLPTGLSLSSAGVISGTPTSFGTSSFTLSCTDQALQVDTKLFTLAVVAVATPTFGSHIGDWMVQAGDQELVLPDGTYDAGHLNLSNCVHAATNGTYGGWLIIRATTKHGAIIDLSSLRFHLEGTSPKRNLRILFVGVKFINGETDINWMKYLRFWYCMWTFPPSVWLGQYTTAYQALHGGQSPTNLSVVDYNALANMENPVGSACSVNQSDNIEWYFCDWDQVYNDSVDIGQSADPFWRGCRWWDNYNHNVQFKNTDGSTRAHSDNIALTSGGVTTVINVNFSGNHFDVEATAGGSSSVFFANGWVMAGDNIGIVGGSHWSADGTTVLHTLSGTIKGLQWCGMAQYQPSDKTNPTYSVAQYGTYTVGSTTLAFNDRLLYGLEPDNSTHLGSVVFKEANGTTISLTTANTNWFAYPSGVTQPGASTASPGLISPDLTSSPIRTMATSVIANHASNPAVVDRAVSGNGFTNYVAFFAASRTDSCSTTNGSATVTDTSAVATDVGKTVTGTGIPSGTRVVEVTAGASFVMSKVATATGSPSLTLKYGWP